MQSYEKILIMEAGGIGDMVMSTPTLRALRKRFSHSEILLLTVPRTAQALEISRYADRVMCFEQDAFSKGPSGFLYRKLFSNLKLIWSLRKEKFDLMIDLEAIESWKSSMLRYLFFLGIGAKKRAGRNSNGKGFFLNVKVYDDLFGKVHEVERKLLIARALGAKTQNKRQEFPVSSDDREFINNWLLDSGVCNNESIVAIHPGAFSPTRQWKCERFVEIGKRLHREYGVKIVLTGDIQDRSVHTIEQELKEESPLLAVGYSLGRFGALLERVQLFISNDTGPAHIADALGTPLVVLFGPENPYRYGPYSDSSRSRIITGMKVPCSPCLKYTCGDHECMDSITSDMVWEGIKPLMENHFKEKTEI